MTGDNCDQNDNISCHCHTQSIDHYNFDPTRLKIDYQSIQPSYQFSQSQVSSANTWNYPIFQSQLSAQTAVSYNNTITTTTQSRKRSLSRLYSCSRYVTPAAHSTKSPGLAETTKSLRHIRSRDKLIIVSLALMNFTVYLCMSIIAPFFPKEAQLKGMSVTMTGYLFSCYSLVVFIFSPILAKLIPHTGAKALLIFGVFSAGVCTILMGTLDGVEDTTMFIICCFSLRSVEALGAASLFTAACTIVAEVFPDNFGTIFGIMETFTGLGGTVGPAIGGFLYSVGGFRMPFYCLGTFMLLTVPCSLYILPSIKSELDTESDGRTSTSYRTLLSNTNVILVLFVIIFLSSGWGFLDPTLEPHLRAYNLSPEQVGLLFLFASASYSITTLICGWLVDHFPNHLYTMMMVGCVSSFGAMLVLGPSSLLSSFLGPSLLGSVLAVVAFGVTYGTALIPTFQALFDVSEKLGLPDDVRTYSLLSGLFSSTYALGEFIGPAVGGLLFDQFGFPIACTAIGFSMLVCGMLLLIYEPIRREWCCMSSKYAYTKVTSDRCKVNEHTPLIVSDEHIASIVS